MFNCPDLHAHVKCDTILYLHSNTNSVYSVLLLLLYDDYKQQYKPRISYLHCIMNDLLNTYILSSTLRTTAVTPACVWSYHTNDKPSILSTLRKALTFLSHLWESLTASKRQSFSRNSNLKTFILSPPPYSLPHSRLIPALKRFLSPDGTIATEEKKKTKD